MHRQRKATTTLTLRARMLLSILCLLLSSAEAMGKDKIVVACDWDFAPYEFINSDGESDGYDIELIHAILQELNIPHEFMMKSRLQCITAFRNEEADLIVDFRNAYTNPDGNYVRTLNPIGYYQLMAAHRSGIADIYTAEQLKANGPVIVSSSSDSVSHLIYDKILGHVDLKAHTVRQALNDIREGDYNYFVWSEAALLWKIKELNLTDIVLNKLEIPACGIYIVGHDKHLIDEIDSQYARMQQRGQAERISNRWFHPERVVEETSHYALYMVIITLLTTLLVFFIYRLMKNRVRAALRRNDDIEAMMHRALSMGNYSVMINDLRQNRIFNLDGHTLPDDGITMEEMMNRVHPDDREGMLSRQKNRGKKNELVKPLRMRWNIGTADAPNWIIISGYSFPEFNHLGRPERIVITARDISDEVRHEQEEMELGSRYRKMFDTSLLAMSFYNKDGYLIDYNQKMQELVGITPENEDFIRNTSLFDFVLLRGVFTRETKEDIYVCQHMCYPELNRDKFIELRVSITHAEDGSVLYYTITARDITNERNLYLDLERQDKALREAEATNSHYEQEMLTLMENCNMFVWRFDLQERVIRFSRSLHEKENTWAVNDYVDSMFEEHRKIAIENIRDMQHIGQAFNMVHHFHRTPINSEPCWYAMSGLPVKDSHGKIVALFGIVRDVTELMEAQQRLKEETARAENSAMLKATFLANMTHEIRTPLNAIVGFSDLLHMVDTTEERKEFIRIIRNNCDMLMRLINDIFEASTMDVKPLEIVPAEVDFAQSFNDICQSLAQRVQEPGVEFIVENPYQQFITYLDKGRMQQVITNFVTNAVKYTHQGHIRVGYRYEDDGIYMYCEDTGAGIPKEQQKKVFDRFVKLNDYVQGTGLGLSICKSIVERSGGRIGIDSEGEGHGSTFWIWVPCPALKEELLEKGKP